MLSMNQIASTSGSSAPANPYDDKRLELLLYQLSMLLQERAAWAKEQMPGAIRVDLRANLDIGSDGKSKSPYRFTVAALVDEKDWTFEVQPGDDWHAAALKLMKDVRKYVACARVKSQIEAGTYETDEKLDVTADRLLDDLERDRRERLEIEHQDGERFENSY